MTRMADETETRTAPGIPGMPAYTPDMMNALNGKGRHIRSVLDSAGYRLIAPPMLEPADVFLEQSGDGIRKRIYVFTDPMGRELCLRPDLTIPTCRMFLRGEAGPLDRNGIARLTYDGAAFRYPRDENNRLAEFRQIGLECIGGASGDLHRLDAEVLGLALDALDQAGAVGKVNLNMGDPGLFSALLQSLDMPDHWRDRLARAFWKQDRFETLLDRYAGQDPEASASDSRTVLAQTLSRLETAEARAMVESILDVAGIEAVGGRSVSEIVDRFIAQAEDRAADPLSDETIALINRFLSLKGHPEEVIAEARSLAKDAGLNLDEALEQFSARWDLMVPSLDKVGLDRERIHFATEFGRTMEYYTGFVFELVTPEPGPDSRLVVGGRYDSLLQRLGSPEPLPAAGFAITLERVLLAADNLKVEAGQ